MFIAGTQKVLVRTVFIDCWVAKTTTFVVSAQAQIRHFQKLNAVFATTGVGGAQDAQTLVWRDVALRILCTTKGCWSVEKVQWGLRLLCREMRDGRHSAGCVICGH